MDNNNRTQNAYMNMAEALDNLVGGAPVPNPNPDPVVINNPQPIPSAPPQIADISSTVFNPLALTIDIPTAEAIDISGNTTTNVGEIESDDSGETTESSEENNNTNASTSDVEHTLGMNSSAPRFNGMHELIAFLQNRHPNIVNDINQSETPPPSPPTAPYETRECGICYNEFNIDKIVNTRCGHTFCNDCFFRWMKGNVTCALCRKNFTSWRRHSQDQINNDITAVTEMFNSSLRENVRLNKRNKSLIKENLKYESDRQQLMKSLVSTRNLIDFNRGYAKGLLSIKRPDYTGSLEYDKGLMKGYEEFRENTRNDRKKKRAARNYLPHGNKKSRENKPMFVFNGSD